MPDVVKVVLHISRRPRGGAWVVKAGAALTLALRFAVVGIGAWAVLERPEMSREAAGALAIGLVWCVAAPLLARPRALRSTVLLTDESLLYADDAAVLDWTDVRAHAVVGDQLLFEPTEEGAPRGPFAQEPLRGAARTGDARSGRRSLPVASARASRDVAPRVSSRRRRSASGVRGNRTPPRR
jgi:hypothetical protein